LKKKLLIIGGSGFVGSSLANYAVNDYDIFLTYNKNKPKNLNFKIFHIDLLDNKENIIDLIQTLKPHYVVHTAAHSSVDLCEIDHDIANMLHVDVTNKITNICASIKCKLIFLSTDAVFEGQLNKQYCETDISNPINYYGKTKLEAEKIVLSASSNNVVLRTSVIYGWHKKSRFTNWILDYLKDGKSVDPFADQFNTPTLIDDLIQVILKIFDKNISGLYHATGKTCLNRYQFAILLAEKFSYDPSLIHSVTKLEKKQNAPRPISTCLDSTKLENLLNFSFSDISTGIESIFNKSKIN
jgi:dTDP-4-dehydrorhamnose reductase